MWTRLCGLALITVAVGSCGPRVYVSSARYELPQDRGEFTSGAVYGSGTVRPGMVRLTADDGAYAQLASDIAAEAHRCPRSQVIPRSRETGRIAQGRRAYWLRVCGDMRLYVLTETGWALVGAQQGVEGTGVRSAPSQDASPQSASDAGVE